MYLLKLVLLE